MSHAEPTGSDSITRRDEQRLRHGRLGVLAVAFFVISAAAPLTGMAGGAPVAMLLGNGAGVPSAYLIVTLVMLVFAVGYVAMARHHTSAGAFYSYVARSMGGHAGGAAAWVALVGYNAMQTGLYGLWGVASAGFLSSLNSSWDIPWWVMALIAWAIIAVLGYRQIDLSLKVLGILVACEFVIVLIFDLMVLVKGAGLGNPAIDTANSLNFSSFTWSEFMSGVPAIGLLFAAASFVGFEATTIYSEEAKKPERTIPRATYVAVLTIGIFFVFTSWLMVNAYDDNATLQQFLVSPDLGGDPTNFLFAMAVPYIGEFLTMKIMLFLFATSVFAALLAFHNAVARYAYALGREGLVPETLGKTHEAHLSPHMGSISQSILALVVILGFAIFDTDNPVLHLFTWLTQLGTLAITYLMAAAALAVLVFFLKNPELDNNVWRTKVAPTVAMIGLIALSIFATMKFKSLTGASTGLTVTLVALIPLGAVIGWISASILKSREPEAYELMGRNRQLQLHEPELDED